MGTCVYGGGGGGVCIIHIYPACRPTVPTTENVEDFTNDVNIKLEFKKMFYIVLETIYT